MYFDLKRMQYQFAVRFSHGVLRSLRPYFYLYVVPSMTSEDVVLDAINGLKSEVQALKLETRQELASQSRQITDLHTLVRKRFDCALTSEKHLKPICTPEHA